MKRKVYRPISDDASDAEIIRGMSKGQLAAWKKADDQLDSGRPMSEAADRRSDMALARKIRRTVK